MTDSELASVALGSRRFTPGAAGLTAWLGGPPGILVGGDLVVSLLGDLIEIMRPYGVWEIGTSEPRTYGLSSRAQGQLAEALKAGRITDLGFVGGSVFDPWGGPQVSVQVSLRSPYGNYFATTVGLDIRRLTQAEAVTAAPILAELITRWFAPLQAAAAFVSDRPEDAAIITVHERSERRGSLLTWPAIGHFLRGVFWGMGLGPSLCARLGGRGRVLVEAPVAVARTIGEGVWLQVTPEPPAGEAALARLAAYLKSLLHWTPAERRALRPTSSSTSTTSETEADSLVSTPQRERDPALGREAGTRVTRGREVPISIIELIDPDVCLNVYLRAAPSRSQQDAVERAMATWYERGFEGQFGRAGFHSLSGPTVDGRVMRWSVDLGSADSQRALEALAHSLGRLSSPRVQRVVVGTEHVA